MKIDSLLEILPETFTASDRELITRAYQFADKAHADQIRASGEPYITHCVAVAAILAEINVPAVIIAAGLLHDTVEDTHTELKEIKASFGEEISKLVDGVTKLTQLPQLHPDEQQLNIETQNAVLVRVNPPGFRVDTGKRSKSYYDLRNETLRKTLLAMSEDIRTVLIKLADRLHNMRTLGYLPEDRRKCIAQETLDIFAPLANRLGIWQIKWELEDLAFRHINPEKFKEISEYISGRRSDRENQIEEIKKRLMSVLEKANIKVEISGRSKHIYSIYHKMIEKGKDFDMLMDLRAVRLIVKDIPTCYTALGVIHTTWRPIPREFDDYIAAPKDNYYQSIHTAIIYDDGTPLEVQIRTLMMHQNAEYGIAAHWRYKEKGGKQDESYQQRINWLRKSIEWRQDIEDDQEFLDSMRTDVFQDRVYIFTPKGDIIDLPSGATPIDFAYHVHTEIGNRCRGAKINGKLVPLDYEIKTGDRIEILTAKQGGPSRDWLNPNLGLIQTQRARSKIRQWFKRQDYDQNCSQGKIILEREMRRLGLDDVDLITIATAFEQKTVDDLFASLGCGDISINRIINKICDISEQGKVKDPLLVSRQPSSEEIGDGSSVTVFGLKGMLTTFGRCCNPAPGDQIIGYITRGRGVTIHRLDCPNMLRIEEKERVIKVSWGEPQKTYPVAIEIKAYDRQGLMGDISNVLKEVGANLIDVNIKISHNLGAIKLVIEVGDINQLSTVLTRIENLHNVMEAHRIKPG
jgi:guanosine-3',5'-bis(diphosphate) 3'-pyrophosphohydrolase